MEFDAANVDLKQRLLKEVARFARRDERLWKLPVVETLRDLENAQMQAVLFGGTLRSLLISRVFNHKLGRPRDIDIVVSGVSLETLKGHVRQLISRETRFGGLQLRRLDWQFDVLPLGQTWAFVKDAIKSPVFAVLTTTTFFNLEAIAVEVWARPGQKRKMFSGDGQFFDGILTRTLEINREENPFPELCVLRALIMASALDFQIGPRLAEYIVCHGEPMTADELDDVQQKHYGQRRRFGPTLRRWIDSVSSLHSKNPTARIRLPISRQLEFWPNPPSLETYDELNTEQVGRS